MSITDIAYSGVGNIKYVFGANSISNDMTGTGDCSSFVQEVYKQAGYNIGRTTGEQWTGTGTEVKKEDLQPGDLVFFKDTYNSGYTDNVSHVGIYTGNNKFVHNSSSAGGVVESELSGYYANHYLGAKRVTGGSEEAATENTGENDLKWWGDVMVLVLTVLLIALGIVFFLSAFNKISIPTPIKKGKEIIKKHGK